MSLKRQVVKTLKPKKDEEFGERVIVDPNVTIGRVYGIFYGAINVGSIAGTLTTTQAEKHVSLQSLFSLASYRSTLSSAQLTRPLLIFLGRILACIHPSIFGVHAGPSSSSLWT